MNRCNVHSLSNAYRTIVNIIVFFVQFFLHFFFFGTVFRVHQLNCIFLHPDMSSKTEYVALDEDDEYQGAPKQNFDTQTGRKKKSNTPKTRMGKIRRSTTQNPSALDVSPDGGMSLASTDGITFTLKGAGSGNTYEPPGSNLSGGSKVNHLVDQKRREQEKARLASLVAAQERHSQMSVSLMSQVQSHHNELIQTEIKDRLSAPDLAQIFYLDDEKPIHKYYAFQCKSIQIEKSRTSNDDRSETAAGYYLDEPLEELPGRTVIFTNQRIIITDSSYAKDVQKDPSCRSRISFQEEQKKDQKGNSMNGTSNLFQDVLPLKLSSTLLSPFGNEGKVSENDFIHAGGPSVSAVPLLTSAPARFNSVTTCDWRYFRSFPLSEITDVRFDFITATRTQGKISYSGGEVPQGVSQHHEDEYDSDEEGCCSFLFGKVNTVRTMAVQPGMYINVYK